MDTDRRIALRSAAPNRVVVIAHGTKDFVEKVVSRKLAEKPLDESEHIDIVVVEKSISHTDRFVVPPSSMDWQQKIASALGVKPGQLTYHLDDAVAKVEELVAIKEGMR